MQDLPEVEGDEATAATREEVAAMDTDAIDRITYECASAAAVCLLGTYGV